MEKILFFVFDSAGNIIGYGTATAAGGAGPIGTYIGAGVLACFGIIVYKAFTGDAASIELIQTIFVPFCGLPVLLTVGTAILYLGAKGFKNARENMEREDKWK